MTTGDTPIRHLGLRVDSRLRMVASRSGKEVVHVCLRNQLETLCGVEPFGTVSQSATGMRLCQNCRRVAILNGLVQPTGDGG